MEPDDPPEIPFGYQAMVAWRRTVTDRALAETKDALSKLWLGNGAGLIASVSALGASHAAGVHAQPWFVLCPICFAVGLICLGIGSLAAIRRDVNWLRDNAEAEGILDVKVGSIRQPHEDLALVPTHPKMALAYAGGVLFLFGVATGIAAAFVAFLA
jgi:hypothetical protein